MSLGELVIEIMEEVRKKYCKSKCEHMEIDFSAKRKYCGIRKTDCSYANSEQVMGNTLFTDTYLVCEK